MLEKIKAQQKLIEETADKLNAQTIKFVNTTNLNNSCKRYSFLEKGIKKDINKKKKLWKLTEIIIFLGIGFSVGYLLPTKNIWVVLFGATLFLGITLGIVIVFIILQKLKR